MKKLLGFMVLAAVVVWAGAAQAGWVLVENREGDLQTSYIQGNVFRFEEPSGQSVLIDLNQGRMYFLNELSNCYWSGTAEEFESEVKASYRVQMEKMLAHAPEDQRSALRAALEIRAPGLTAAEGRASIEVRATSARAEIAGYLTQKHEVWVDGRLEGEVWLAEKVGAAQEIDPVAMGRFLAALYSADQRRGFAYAPEVTALYGRGWPLRIVEYGEDGQVHVTQTSRIEEKPLPESMFKVARGSARVSLLELLDAATGS
ncbi:MAG: hypothetical protein AB1896_01515 [Thermodesulfobacteriota bacterium]